MTPMTHGCDPCRCALTTQEFRRTISDIENRVYRDIREVLAAPADEDNFGYPFHFAVLNGDQREAVSRGHESSVADSDAADRYAKSVRAATEEVLRREPQLNVTDVMRLLAPDGRLADDVRSGFEAYSSIEGQPLAEHQPSRFEQCAAIRTAWDNGFTGIPKSIKPFGGVIVVEDYLGSCDELVANYEKALRVLDLYHADRHGQRNEQPICTSETAPFLVAEHLQLFSSAGGNTTFDQWLDELPERRPGLAFLPFRVLGQYRAAGVWLFQGRFDSPGNERLRNHLEETAKTERWLAKTTSHAALQATSILFLRSLTQFKDLIGTPLTRCHLAQRALASLWYTETPMLLEEEPLTGDEPWHIGPRNGLRQEIAIQVAFGESVADLLSFETARFICPFIPKDADLKRELVNAAGVFRDISEAASAVYRRTGTQIRAAVNHQVALTAHDYANGLRELMSVAGVNPDDTGPGPSAELRLNIVHDLADRLLGHAWVARDVAKRHDDTSFEEWRLTELKLRDGAPEESDLEFWRDFVRRDAIVIGYCAVVTAFRAQGGFVGTLGLAYRFRGHTADGPWAGGTARESIPIVPAALELCTAGQKRSGSVPWPMPLEARTEKLMELGQRAAMMWGARELLRNAFGETATHASTHRGEAVVAVDVEICRDQDDWTLRVAVTNPWTKLNERPREVHDISKWPKYIKEVLRNVKFKTVPSSDHEVSYVYEFEVKGGSKPEALLSR